MRAPVLFFAAAAMGALTAFATEIPTSLAVAALAVVVPLGFVGRARAARAVSLVVLAALAPFTLCRATIERHDAVTRSFVDDVVVVEGLVRTAAPRREGGQRLVLDVTAHDRGHEAPLPVLDVSLLGDAGLVDVEPGDRVRARGRIRPYLVAEAPGAFDARLYGIGRGVHGRLAIGDRSAIAVVEKRATPAPFARAARALLVELKRQATPHEAALVAALLTGDTSGFEASDLEMYRRAGAGHLLAVSGLQVSLLAALLFALLAGLLTLVRPLAERGLSSTIATLGALLAIWAYVFVCGAPPSCVRAALMASAGLLAMLPGRRVALVDALSLAGLVTLLVSPTAIVDAGFLLSYAAVIGLALATTTADDEQRLVDRARAVVTSAVGAGIVTLPVSAQLFGELAPGGVVANIVLVPAAALLQIPAIVGGLAGALFSSSALVAIGAASAGLLEALVEGMADLVGGVVLVEPPSVVAALALFAAALALARGLAERSARLVVLGLLAVLAISFLPSALARPTTTVTFLPVGQGDSALIETASGHAILVDGGGVWDESVDPGTDVVLPALARRGIDRLDVVVLSHPDPDHLLGLLPVLLHVEVGALWHAGMSERHPLLARLTAIAKARGVEILTARDLPPTTRFGDTVVEVLAPLPESDDATYGELSANDNSLVLRVSRGASSILLTGDIERWGERYLLDAGRDLHATILKAPHHGSRTSSSEALIDAVKPAHAVFPTGRANTFGFPHDEVVERYRSRSICLWDIGTHGRVTFTLGPSDVEVRHAIAQALPCELPR